MSSTPRAGGISLEQRSIDYIPDEERHGHPNTLLTLWFASNVQITAVAVGALAVVLGLNLPWAIVTILVGNLLGGLFMAYHSIQGPKLGVPQMIQSRAQFGMFGATLPVVVVLLMYVGFFVSSGVLGGQAIAGLLHVSTPVGIVIADAVVLLITWVGYDLFHAYDRVVSVLSLIIFLVLLVKLAGMLPAHAPKSSVTPGTVLLVISIFAAWQITWAPYVSDYSRYLPRATSSARTFWFTYLGSAVGACFVMIVGALGAVVAESQISSNAPAYLAGLFPQVRWLFLVIIVLGVFAANLENLYGAFLTAFTSLSPSGRLAAGVRSRIVATTVVAIIGTVVAIAASANFLTNLTNFVVFLLYFLIPWTAINLTDYYLVRHGHYDIEAIFKVDGVYGRFNWTAIGIYVLTILVELPFVDSSIYEGPIAKAMGGGDIAWIVGFFVAGLLYYASMRMTGSRPAGEALPATGSKP
ncbi:MAG: purine-cytosine permease family protein [Candidatus Dormibacteria bacterium]